jgi:hypothetical protein
MLSSSLGSLKKSLNVSKCPAFELRCVRSVRVHFAAITLYLVLHSVTAGGISQTRPYFLVTGNGGSRVRYQIPSILILRNTV